MNGLGISMPMETVLRGTVGLVGSEDAGQPPKGAIVFSICGTRMAISRELAEQVKVSPL